VTTRKRKHRHPFAAAAAGIGGFKGWAKRAMPSPSNYAPNKFQERPSGASRMQENFLAARAPARTPLGELTHYPSPSWWGGG